MLYGPTDMGMVACVSEVFIGMGGGIVGREGDDGVGVAWRRRRLLGDKTA